MAGDSPKINFVSPRLNKINELLLGKRICEYANSDGRDDDEFRNESTNAVGHETKSDGKVALHCL